MKLENIDKIKKLSDELKTLDQSLEELQKLAMFLSDNDCSVVFSMKARNLNVPTPPPPPKVKKQKGGEPVAFSIVDMNGDPMPPMVEEAIFQTFAGFCMHVPPREEPILAEMNLDSSISDISALQILAIILESVRKRRRSILYKLSKMGVEA